MRVVPEGRSFLLPARLLAEPGQLRMQVVGYEGEAVRIVTEREASPLVVVESGAYDGAVPPEPDQPDLWAKLMADVEAATKAASSAAGAATQAAQAAEAAAKSATDGAAKAESAASSTIEGELRRVRAEASRVEAEKARAAAESARAGAEDKRAASESARTKAETARDAAEKAREAAEQRRAAATAEAVKKAADAAAKADEAAATADAGEQGRVTAEHGRAEAEKARVTADAERGMRVGASVKKADGATAKATEAAGKADAAATEANAAAKRADEAAKGASGNILVGTETAAVVHVEDAWPSQLRECRVLGKSEQVVTTGSQLFRPIGTETVNGVAFAAEADGSYHVKGKQDKAFTRVFSDSGAKVPLSGYGIKPGDTIYLSCAGASAKCYACIQFFSDGSDSYTMIAASSAVSTYKVPETMTGAFCFISLDGTVGTSVDVELRPMLSKSRGAAWEPYTGAKPSPSPKYPQPIASIGKTELMVTGRNLARSFKSAPHQSRWAGALFIDADLMPSTTYTLSFSSTTSNSYYINEVLFDNFQTITPGGGRTSVKLVTKSGIDKNIAGQHNAQGWVILKNNKEQDHAPSFTGVQLEFGEVATGFVPYSGAIHTIDLQGNELRSLPNGVHDEVVVDREGNASLVKRVGSIKLTDVGIAVDNGATPSGVRRYAITALQAAPGKKYQAGANNAMSDIFRQLSNYSALEANHFYVNGEIIIFGCDKQSVVDFCAWINELSPIIYYELATPQTIPLGRVSAPALSESTSNVWNADAITADVSATYVRDVTLAFADLESKLTQAVVAAAANL